VPLGSAEEETIVRAIVRAGREPGWTDQIGARARDFIAQRHSFARTVEGYRTVIEQTVPR